MFWAINKRTGKTVNSIEMINDPTYILPHEDDWIADPDEIQNWEEVSKKYSEIKVVPVSDKKFINYNGTKVVVSPHFKILNATKLGINSIPESREHKMAKNWIYNRVKNKDLEIHYSYNKKLKKEINPVKISELPIDLNGLSIETRVISRGVRIADVLLPFHMKHPQLGDGIVFEIQFSRQKPSTEERRTQDWAYRGFSVCWLHESDFERLSNVLIELKDNNLKINSWATTLKESNKSQIKELKFCVKNLANMLDSKMEELNEKMREMDNKKDKIHKLIIKANNIFSSNQSIKNYEKIIEERYKEVANNILSKVIDESSVGDQLAKLYSKMAELEKLFLDIKVNYNSKNCPKCGQPMILPKKGSYGSFWGCSGYPDCKKTIPLFTSLYK